MLCRRLVDDRISGSALDLSACQLTNVSVLSYYDHLQRITLVSNFIQSLVFCDRMWTLRELYVYHNRIGDAEEVHHLVGCKNLRQLGIKHNPMCNAEGYERFVVLALPQLCILDGERITIPERKTAKRVERIERAELPENVYQPCFSQHSAETHSAGPQDVVYSARAERESRTRERASLELRNLLDMKTQAIMQAVYQLVYMLSGPDLDSIIDFIAMRQRQCALPFDIVASHQKND